MTATIQKWGNSLAVRLPRAVAEQIHVHEGDAVELKVDDHTLNIKSARKKYNAADLIKAVKPSNLHAETDWGKATGKEVW